MRSVALAVFAGLALGLAACGEKDEPEPTAPTDIEAPSGSGGGAGGNGGGGGAGGASSDEKRIEAAIQEVAGGGDPVKACDELVTARYVRTAYGDEGGCRAAVADQPTFDVEVRAIEIEGPVAGFDRVAAANAFPRGGPNRGMHLEVRLVREAGTWRVDFLRSDAPPGP